MPDGRAARIALEAGFLVAVAVVLGIADVRPLWIVLVMLLAWVIVALLEWAAWREEPHWASGSPPRYYVPQQELPPRPPSEELPAFGSYPRAPVEPRATEAPTWIATPEMREELLGWPAPQPQSEPAPEPAQPAVAEPAPLPAPESAARAGDPQQEPESRAGELSEELLNAASVTVEPGLEAEEPHSGWPLEDGDTATDPWTVADLGEQPEVPGDNLPQGADAAVPASPGDASSQGRTDVVLEPASDDSSHDRTDAGPETARDDSPHGRDGRDLEPARDESSHTSNGAGSDQSRLARHRIDPFEAEDRRRWPWQRRVESGAAVAELPPLPRHVPLEPEDDR